MRWLAVLLVLGTPLSVSYLSSASLRLINRQDAKNTPSPRKEISLNGQWRFRRDDQKEWKNVTLPTHWETHEGLKFDGIGWYEKTLEPITLAKGRRLLLHFDAVATHATVYWNDVKLGEHLGAWTPFRFDVTEQIQKLPPSPLGGEGSGVRGKHTIRVRVDEKVGHNTQGFLPIIEPHFGGIWQGVKLIEVPETYFDDLNVKFVAEQYGWLSFSVPIVGPKPRLSQLNLVIHELKNGKRNEFAEWNARELGFQLNRNIFEGSIDSSSPDTWQPGNPTRHECKLILKNTKNDTILDQVATTVGFRTIETKGDQFLLNGQPLSIRGVLNWGYYPPSLSPNPPEEVWRSDLKLIKSWGFNLMKCCLWVPPKRLLEIADEEGVLIWMEYPTWHPQLTKKYEAELLREYKEFHQHDRNHPSVILRSLTCETGPGADLGVIKKLYDQCKQMCGGLVVDDSSWIEWNRICDFYDDHPYGNNHTWVKTLTRLKDYIAHSKLGVKPLCLGEAIAADTWVPTKPMLEAIAKAKVDPKQAWSLDERGYPYWVPGFFDANQAWLKRMEKVCGGPIDEKKLEEDSLRYAWLMRKYQIANYRKEVPNGGYVVSVIRDFPLASMGLIDYENNPKWTKKQWAGHGDTWKEEDTWDPRTPVGGLDIPILPFRLEEYRTAKKLDLELLDFLEKGGKVLLNPDGTSGSFPLQSHWFLRGGPFVNSHHPLFKSDPKLHEALVDQQHFFFSSDVIPDINYLEEIDPILMLWDNHDLKEVKTHGLLFETRVGKGRLMVSAITLMAWQIEQLLNGPPPRNALKPETIARMRAKLNEKRLDLVAKSWQFMPDGKEEGLKLGWHQPDFDDKAWKPIKIGKHWEAQGYPDLDGWAWYRLKVDIPKDWAPPHPQPLSPEGRGETLYLNSEGVDDAYEIYFNGTKIGAGGDIPNKKTAFEERKAHAIPASLLKPGESNLIAIRVYDWYGAGGIHRPMTLSNIPIGGVDILK